MNDGPVMNRWMTAVVRISLLLLGVALMWAVLVLPPEPVGLSNQVKRAMPESGVLHPLTAVLLNFRGYDTLLEIGVLLVAVVAVWSLDHAAPSRLRLRAPSHRNPVLQVGLGLLVPVMAVMAGYMVWVGAYRPGGAFQAGAMLGAVAVTLIASGMLSAPLARGGGTRVTLAAGFIWFMAVASALALWRGSLLRYPETAASLVILAIETVLAVSIGAALAALFAAVSGLPDEASAREETR
jgi:multisubunit Na+/H+ antiporter MnhB subunit